MLVHESLIQRAKKALDRVQAMKREERAKKEKLVKDCERLSEVASAKENKRVIRFEKEEGGGGNRIVNINGGEGTRLPSRGGSRNIKTHYDSNGGIFSP